MGRYYEIMKLTGTEWSSQEGRQGEESKKILISALLGIVNEDLDFLIFLLSSNFTHPAIFLGLAHLLSNTWKTAILV